ncbi:MAG: hypothetical protein F4Y47_08495 [Acidobacteriia bacterium]|nr:hypothetical protein [Terriglobia bacterium]MYG03969.1 hypothetical protein [Terriglobia bacterium]MYK11868.1 hypothetical protein [Terriglobia bacterium]
MGRILSGLLLVALLAPGIAGQDISNRLERFYLFNACRPMQLVVEELDDDAADIGLTQEALQAAAESRLRAARLYAVDGIRADFSHLYVNINVTPRAFSVSLAYYKWVTDEFGQSASAQTWHSGATGTHGGDAGYIVSALSQYLDTFLAAYLRVNEESCGSPAGRP